MIEVLAAALGVTVDPADVIIAAANYQPQPDDPAADAAVARLIDACGGTADEATAAVIGLLVQACDATAALIANATISLLRNGKPVDEALRAPAVLATRRMINGEPRFFYGGEQLAQNASFPANPGGGGPTALVAGDLDVTCQVHVTCRY